MTDRATADWTQASPSPDGGPSSTNLPPPAPAEDTDPSTLVSNAPPPAPEQIIDKTDPTKAGPSLYDDPEFIKEFEESLAKQIEGWQKDWSLRINALMEALDLSRSEAMLYLLLMQVGGLRGLASGFQQMWNDEPAQRRRAMQDALLEAQLKERGYSEKRQEPALLVGEALKQAVQGWRIP
jgi:hypothetical protein